MTELLRIREAAPSLRARVVAFLDISGVKTSPEMLGLWVAALTPHQDDVERAMVKWLRTSDAPATPRDLIRIIGDTSVVLTLREVIQEVADEHGLMVEDFQGKKRYRRVAWPRQEAMAAAHRAGFSLHEIGKFLGRDHTTVLAGIRAHKDRTEHAREIEI